MRTLINKNIKRNFLKKLKKSADWKNPKPQKKLVKIVSYFLKNGDIVKIERENSRQNFIWKFVKPQKYYFLKMKIKSQKLKEQELRKIANKWQIETKK